MNKISTELFVEWIDFRIDTANISHVTTTELKINIGY